MIKIDSKDFYIVTKDFHFKYIPYFFFFYSSNNCEKYISQFPQKY